MADESTKEQLARIEKFAQSHFDRSYAISSGTAKAALAWLVALLLLWFQQLEPKLDAVRAARASLQTKQASSTLIRPAQFEPAANFAERDMLAKNEKVELPFGIKFDCPPAWLVTLWLALAFCLGCYLLNARRRILELVARGLRLLEAEVKAEPALVKKIVGKAAWWLAPLPNRQGLVLTPQKLRNAVGWTDPTSPSKPLLIPLFIATLVAAETRVFYIGFCVAFYLAPGMWLLINAANIMLFVATAVLLQRWFASTEVPDLLAGEAALPCQPNRRWALRMLMRSALPLGALILLCGSTTAFAAISRIGKKHLSSRSQKRTRRKRKHHTKLAAPKDTGFYINRKSHTVHTTACSSCVAGMNISHFAKLKIPDSEINFNGRKESSAQRSQLLRSPLGQIQSYQSRALELRHGLRVDQPTSQREIYTPHRAQGLRTEKTSKGAGKSGLMFDQQTDRGADMGTWEDLHPHALHRTFMIEKVAIELVQQNPESACKFLAKAIEATPLFGIRTSMRLFDLLAGLSVRFGFEKYLDILTRVVQKELDNTQLFEKPPARSQLATFLSWLATDEVPPLGRESSARKEHHKGRERQLPCTPGRRPRKSRQRKNAQMSHTAYLASVLDKRIIKWQNKEGKWHRKWANREHAINWACGRIA